VFNRPWKDHFKSDLRSDQDHLRSDQEGQNFKMDKMSTLNHDLRSLIFKIFQGLIFNNEVH
jgi:hypothetical protein